MGLKMICGCLYKLAFTRPPVDSEKMSQQDLDLLINRIPLVLERFPCTRFNIDVRHKDMMVVAGNEIWRNETI